MPRQQERARSGVWVLGVFQTNLGCSAAPTLVVPAAALAATIVKGARQLVVWTACKLRTSPVVILHA
jgi:hypothetical protein